MQDHLGNTRALTADNGTVVTTMDYWPYGAMLSQTGSGDTRFKYTGHERDDESALDYMLARIYEHKTGRFMQMDPLADKYPGLSPYVYAAGNPVKFVDPDGCFFFLPALAGAGAGSGGLAAIGAGVTKGALVVAGTIVCAFAASQTDAVQDLINGTPVNVPATVETGPLVNNPQNFETGVLSIPLADSPADHTLVNVPAELPGNGILHANDNHQTGLGNPFKDKSAEEIDRMFKDAGFEESDDAPLTGKGGYVNPKTGRSYHIDPKDSGKYREPNHVDVNRSRGYKGTLKKKKFPYKE